MSEPIARLQSLQVADVMTRNVVELFYSEPMTEAAQAFVKHGVSCAPVIDEQDRCIGMLSAIDFLPAKYTEGQTVASNNAGGNNEPADPAPDNAVSSFMTHVVRSITPETSLLKAAQIMNSEHIHRLPVLDPRGRVLGMISTMDIIASLLNSIDESASELLKQMRSTES